MSGITGLGSPTLASLLAGGSSSDSSTLTPLQRAQALAQSVAANGGASSPQEAQLLAQSEQSALSAELASALAPTDTSDYGPAYDLSSGLFDYAYNSTADNAALNVLDQIGSLTPPTQWQAIQTPTGATPGESQSVAEADQISYQQVVTPSDATASANAPSLGTIGTNAGRLVLLGALSSNASDVQTYSFNLQQAGQLHILAPDPNSSDPTASLGAVHMQVYDSGGNLVADSDPSTGEAYLAYVKLDQTALAGADLNGGQYTIKLSYNANAAPGAKGDYSLFIESGSDPGRVTYYTTTNNLNAAPATAQPSPTTTPYVPALSLLA